MNIRPKTGAFKHFIFTRQELFLLVTTLVVTLALIGLIYFAINTLASRDWCAQIMAAEKFTGDKTRTDVATVQFVVRECSELLQSQLDSVGWVAKILAAALAISVTGMYVVKFAGAEASGEIAGNKWNFAPGKNKEGDNAGEGTVKHVEADVVVTNPTIDPSEQRG